MNVEQLRRLEQAATPGPWSSDTGGGEHGEQVQVTESKWDLAVIVEDVPPELRDSSLEQRIADARLIAAARNALPALLDIAEAADLLSGYARHENDCARTTALMAGETGTPCDCGFKDALASYQAALSRLDTEGQR